MTVSRLKDRPIIGHMFFIEKCPVCTETRFKQYRQYFDSYLVKCENCQLVFMNPRPPKDWIDAYYRNSSIHDQTVADNKWFGSPQERLLEFKYPKSFKRYNSAIIDDIQTYVKPGNILDIGCSMGTLLRLARDRGWMVSGLEPAEEVAAYTSKAYDLVVYTSDLCRLHLESDSYDCITMIHVLEHLTDLKLYLTEAYRLLKQDGILYIRVPNLNSFKYKLVGQYYFFHVPEHLTWFSLNSLGYLLEKHKFKMIENHTSCYSNDPYFYFGIIKQLNLDSLLFNVLGYDSKQWKEEDNGNIGDKRTYTKPKSKMYGYIDKITKFLNFFWPNYLITLVGMGDELIVIAQKSAGGETN